MVLMCCYCSGKCMCESGWQGDQCDEGEIATLFA